VNLTHPELSDPSALPRRVLVLAPHPDDEVLGCGGLLALLAARGATLRVVVVSDGAQGGPVSTGTDLVQRREQETRAAGAELGCADQRFLRLPDRGLGAQHDLVQRLQRELEDFAPELVLAPWPLEHHPDHRAVSRAACSALDQGPARSVLLYGVDAPATANVLYDISAVWTRKRAALACFESQNERHDLLAKAEAAGRARTLDVADPAVRQAEGFVRLESGTLLAWSKKALELASELAPEPRLEATAVISTWNKKEDLRANLDALRAQTLPFADIVVVDNASRDGTADLVRAAYPEVRLIVMPHDRYGACETFNIGFASSRTPLTAILDDDIVMPPDWLEKACARLQREPATTAILSTQVTEPGMPPGYLAGARHNQERYMSTFRGCASLARTQALREARFYDERLFIYGNERDLTCRLFNLGYRVLQYPGCGVFHKTPFGIKLGKRSLYYHARNAWLSMLKYAPLADLVRMPWLVLTRVVLRRGRQEAQGEVSDATGTIGIGRSLRETPGAWWVVTRAAFSVLANVPYCLAQRAPVRHPDFELPLQ
jgi:LmbE family N-acetylglucosaminyl deacetylase/GT2 family glycosyltransferase